MTSRWHSVSEQISFPIILNKDQLDLMHFTYFSYPIAYSKKFISTVHDVTPLLFKTGKASTKNRIFYNAKYRAFKFVLSNQVKYAQKIITPSEVVKDQLYDIYGDEVGKKVVPIYEGVDHELMQTAENENLIHRFPKPFMLYVGNFYPHKNTDRLVDAYKTLDETIPLILVGPNNYFSERLKYKVKQEKIKNIIFYHNARTPELVFFYKHAVALINPSLSEGFGLPLLEAAHFKLPIIASDLPVFRELFGDKFVRFDPTNVGDIHAKLSSFIELRPRIDYGDVMKKYSFKKMAKEIVEEYKN